MIQCIKKGFLMALMNLTKENFNEVVENNDIVVMDFWQFAPIFEKVASEYPDIVFGKINTEEEQELAAHFQIQSIPTVMIMREQIVVFAQPGMLPEDGLKDLINKVKELDMDAIRKEIAEQEAQK